MKTMLLILFAVLIQGCKSHPVLMETKDIKVTRDEAKSNCRDLGPVEGKVINTKPSPDMALEDMKKEAAAKGANFVKMETASIYGTAVRGTAFFCP